MLAFYIFCGIFLWSTYVRAVPVALVMGCGRPLAELADEKAKFCCEQFNMACQPTAQPVLVKEETKEGTSKVEIRKSLKKIVRMKPLGSRCQEPRFRCAIGLECRNGLCVRKKSRAHLQELMNRGKAIEMEEQNIADDGTDEEEGDPLPAQKGLILHGQSVNVGDRVPPELLKSSEDGGTWSKRESRKNSGERGRWARETINADSGELETEDSEETEEGEIASNVGDLLASKLGLPLDAEERRNLRELIAGTIDEREEREDEVEDSEQEFQNTSKVYGKDTEYSQRIHCGKDDAEKKDCSYRHPTRKEIEARNQCPSEDAGHSMSAVVRAAAGRMNAVSADSIPVHI